MLYRAEALSVASRERSISLKAPVSADASTPEPSTVTLKRSPIRILTSPLFDALEIEQAPDASVEPRRRGAARELFTVTMWKRTQCGGDEQPRGSLGGQPSRCSAQLDRRGMLGFGEARGR